MDLGPRVRFRAKSGTQGSSSPLEIGLALLGFTIKCHTSRLPGARPGPLAAHESARMNMALSRGGRPGLGTHGAARKKPEEGRSGAASSFSSCRTCNETDRRRTAEGGGAAQCGSPSVQWVLPLPGGGGDG